MGSRPDLQLSTQTICPHAAPGRRREPVLTLILGCLLLFNGEQVWSLLSLHSCAGDTLQGEHLMARRVRAGGSLWVGTGVQALRQVQAPGAGDRRRQQRRRDRRQLRRHVRHRRQQLTGKWRQHARERFRRQWRHRQPHRCEAGRRAAAHACMCSSYCSCVSGQPMCMCLETPGLSRSHSMPAGGTNSGTSSSGLSGMSGSTGSGSSTPGSTSTGGGIASSQGGSSDNLASAVKSGFIGSMSGPSQSTPILSAGSGTGARRVAVTPSVRGTG